MTNSAIFDASAAYYDLLYRDKNYSREVTFVDELIQKHAPKSTTLLDLGCGTGMHDWLFSEKGYEVTGIDQSPQMLEKARARAAQYSNVTTPPSFEIGDLTDFFSKRKNDVVVALFDVVSYLPDYKSISAMAANINNALKPGGLFIFDCWYGPAVYTDKPQTRIRRIEDETTSLTRISDSSFDSRHGRVDVAYEIFVKRKEDGFIQTFNELHKMRCYFVDELDALLGAAGLVRVFNMQWFTKEPPNDRSRSVLFGYQLSRQQF